MSDLVGKLIALMYGLLFLKVGGTASDPATVFPVTTNELSPTSYWLDNKKPYPTNAWFINFLFANSQPVNISPYIVKVNPQGLGLSYSSPYTYKERNYAEISALFYQYEDQLHLGSLEPMTEYGLESYKGLIANLKWQNAAQQKIAAPLVQGSPYLTEFFTQATPQLTSRYKWLSINNQAQDVPMPASNRYQILLQLDETNTQTWVLYTQYPLELTWTTSTAGEKLVAKNAYSGWVRLVLQADTARGINNDPNILDQYSATIPLDYQQNYFTTDKNLMYSWSWKTQNNQAPLMLSLAHQRNALMQTQPVSYSGIKGLMQGQAQQTWNVELPLIPILFLEPKNISSQQRHVLAQALEEEAAIFLKEKKLPEEGPYLTGKRLARIARLILIADFLGMSELRQQMISHTQSILLDFMQGQNSWFFQYDQTWGGIIPSKDNYGARHYNDHHYHYGYWVYTFAVLAKFDLKWLKTKLQDKPFTPEEWIHFLILDYANKDPNNPYFTYQRHQDDYAGHSWASGLTPDAAGQNEQSSSEAVNAYYALALYAKATNDSATYNWAQFLMSRELKSAQLYWQIPANSPVYSEAFKKENQVIGNLWASKVDANAYFIKCTEAYRCGLHYSFGMQMLPFTAITSYLLNKEWLINAHPTIKKLISGQFGAIERAWFWILVKGIVPVMMAKEKLHFFQQAIDSKPDEYDNGDSKTNTLFYLIND
ncbi:glycosyl hydrolase [Legionella shakespearei]|uniref:glucan endo-1,3-beta-D-glucosidase n=1 Tax=Legionella shakespearei DSM 23087 TaxID=1122169 RepID=A0A0W0YU14_9GAMM|nr:glycosyl hydrolase [Legionella shakespearei]KTD60067.1 Glycosyl hydrolase family 81 [Legionella shakespearei DSM 23087]